MTYEGNKRVRYHKLQKLWAEYDAMADDESVDEFQCRRINLTNEFGRLGDPFAEHIIVKKFLRALPLRFRGKATVIEETQDLNTYSLNELLANLQNFERCHKLQKLWAEYDAMAMADDESVDDFHSRLINMTDEFGRLGDPFAEHTIVKKFLRALPLSFRDKVTVIEEFRNLNTYPLNELLGNLQAYEMRIKERKLKSIASSVVRKEEKKTKEAVEENDSDLEFTAKEYALLFKQYEKFIRSGESTQDLKNSLRTSSKRNLGRDFASEKDTKPRFTQKKHTKDKPRCFECRGIGHLAADCANKKLKGRLNKVMNATWSDSESDTHSDGGEEYLALGIFKVVLNE